MEEVNCNLVFKFENTGLEIKDSLTPEEREECRVKVDDFIKNKDPTYNLILSNLIINK